VTSFGVIMTNTKITNSSWPFVTLFGWYEIATIAKCLRLEEPMGLLQHDNKAALRATVFFSVCLLHAVAF